ncbi:phytochrome-like protein cph2 [mine drainage metagenome]|uniref:Phytochrome-like protein cph2 n=1 Tax=mine drainage metagenome TaxID=410659 RepID=A0A1J5QAY2_9ZZZZ
MHKLPELRWDASIATGVAEIDAQHQHLFDIFNAAARAQADGSAQADALISELIDYTREHFRHEAELMRRWPVDPQRKAAHLQAHQRFTEFLDQAQAVAAEQPAEAVLDLLAFLAQWLLHHVAGVDTRLAREVRALEAGEPLPESDAADPLQRMGDALGQLTDALVQRTFELLSERERLANLQKLYQALLHSSDVLIQSRSEHEMLDSLCSKVVQHTPFHAAWIGRPQGEGELFEVLAMHGDGIAQVESALPRLTPEYRTSMTVRAWTGQQLLYSNDTLADPLIAPWHAGLAKHRWFSALAVPIVRGEQVWAVLTLASPRRGTFDEATLDVCSRIAALLGYGLDELDLKARIQSLQSVEASLARTDALTALPNRFALDEHLRDAIARAQRQGLLLALGLLDLDDFKRVNDQHGHDAGDVLLREFGGRVRAGLRGADFFARLGGDEFVVMFEALDAGAQIEAGLQRLHRAVETPFTLPGGVRATVGMTMGIALYPADGQTVRELLREADAAMYQAKLRKGDRLHWWRFAGDAL